MGRRKKGRYETPVLLYKKTDDDWSSNFDGNLVELEFHGNINHSGSGLPIYRISVWGDDDIGMDRDFDNKADAIKFFEKVEALPVLNHKELLSLGFNWF